MRVEAAVFAEEAMLQVGWELDLSGIWLTALWASCGKSTALRMVIQLSLAWKDALAAHTLEVVAFEVMVQYGLVWAIEVASGLQAVLMF
jgi:hypothetical protein